MISCVHPSGSKKKSFELDHHCFPCWRAHSPFNVLWLLLCLPTVCLCTYYSYVIIGIPKNVTPSKLSIASSVTNICGVQIHCSVLSGCRIVCLFNSQSKHSWCETPIYQQTSWSLTCLTLTCSLMAYFKENWRGQFYSFDSLRPNPISTPSPSPSPLFWRGKG